MKHLRLSLVGFSVVGQGLAELLYTKRGQLQREFGFDVTLVSVANARHGFIYREDRAGYSYIAGISQHTTTFDRASRYTPLCQCLARFTDPRKRRHAGRGHRHQFTRRGTRHQPYSSSTLTGNDVITANKGPAALAAGELFALAREHQAQLRIESTVMAGTPVISTIREGMAGATCTCHTRYSQRHHELYS